MPIDIRSELKTNHELRATLRHMSEAGTIQWSDTPFTLKSGIESHVYVFGREDVTDNTILGGFLGTQIARVALQAHQPSIGRKKLCAIGIPTAGTALAASVAFVNNSFCYRIMREAKKEHGAHRSWVNGKPDLEHHQYFTIDNVITDGKSKFEVMPRLEEDEYPASEMLHLTLIDREQGGLQRLRAAGYHAESVFTLLDVVWAFGELGFWTLDQVRKVEDEIAAHQINA